MKSSSDLSYGGDGGNNSDGYGGGDGVSVSGSGKRRVSIVNMEVTEEATEVAEAAEGGSSSNDRRSKGRVDGQNVRIVREREQSQRRQVQEQEKQ